MTLKNQNSYQAIFQLFNTKGHFAQSGNKSHSLVVIQ